MEAITRLESVGWSVGRAGFSSPEKSCRRAIRFDSLDSTPRVFCFFFVVFVVTLCGGGERLRDHHRNMTTGGSTCMDLYLCPTCPKRSNRSIPYYVVCCCSLSNLIKCRMKFLSLVLSLHSFDQNGGQALVPSRRRRHKFFIIRLQIMMAFPNAYIFSLLTRLLVYKS